MQNPLTSIAKWWLQRSGTAKPDQWLIDWVRGGARSSSGMIVNQQRAMEDIVTMACVSIRAQDLAKLPVHVYRVQRNGEQQIIETHPLEKILRKPNAWQTRFEFLEQMQVSYLLKSNAYAPIVRDGRANPTSLIPVSPDRVCMYEAPDGELYYQVTRTGPHQTAMLKSLPSLISVADMVHLRWLTFNGLLGVSRLNLMRDEIGLNLSLLEHSARLFSQGARPGGVLQTDKKLSDEGFARLKSQWEEKYGGAENSGRTALLEEGLKFEPMTMTSVESETVDATESQMRKIAAGWDVPLHRLGIMPDGGTPAIFEANQMYLNHTLSSDAERWEAKLNDAFGLDGEKEFVEFDLDYFNRADPKNRMEAMRIGIVGSIISVNEARRRLGYPDDPKGDVIFQPANVVPLGSPPPQPNTPKPAGPGSDVTGEPAAGGDGDSAAVPDETKPNGAAVAG